jgi:NADPH:quinone reductase-like Zn-dependent oxidoreductase
MVDPGVPGRLAIGEVSAPAPKPNEALVQVAAISLNRGEVRRSQNEKAGYRPGWDLAGTIAQAAADGSGPEVGARAVGFLASGAWAEQVAVPTDALAELPPEVSFAQAATLPVAGLTALYSLGKGGTLLGRSVLVTGASGGVGDFTVQLARHAGASVVAVIRQPSREALVRDAGAHEVVISDDAAEAEPLGPYHLVVDGVGGKVLGNALAMLAPGGVAVAYGATPSAEVTFDIARFFRTGGVTLYGLYVFYELRFESASVGLARLVRLVAEGNLRPHVEVEADWTEIASVGQRLMNREFAGKAVLHLKS